MTIYEIRKRNLQELIASKYGGITRRLAQAAEMELSQLSRVLGPAGRGNLGSRVARRIEIVAGKPVGWLDVEHKEAAPKQTAKIHGFGDYQQVPVVGFEIAARWIISGPPYPVSHADHIDWIQSPDNPKLLGIIVPSEEMADEILSGDVVFVNPRLTPQPGDYVFAELPEESALVLRKYRLLGRDKTGNYRQELIPLNKDFPTYQIDSKHAGRILGVVIEHRRYRDRHPSKDRMSRLIERDKNRFG